VAVSQFQSYGRRGNGPLYINVPNGSGAGLGTQQAQAVIRQSHLAAMIGNPRQLLEPYDMTIPDSQRRQVIYDKYIQGENPASTQPDRQQVSVEN